MKTLVAYSSLSGNTKYIAEGIYEALEGDKEISSVRKVDNWEEFDNIIIGYWVDKGGPNKEAMRFMEKIKGKKVGVFATLGVDPTGDHANKAIQRGIDMLSEENDVYGSFICQGRLSEDIIKRLSSLPKDHSHYPSEERFRKWKISSVHPNEEDVKAAVKALIKH